MSNPGQAIAAIGGAIVGFVVTGFNPAGAAYGFQLGMLAGSLLFPTELPGVQGPRLEDLATTSAQIGGPIHYVYGVIAVPGTVIWLGTMIETATTTEADSGGGKGIGGGGGGQSTTTFSYNQSIAVGLCEGPISGVLRIWENGELVYDIRVQQDGETTAAYDERIAASTTYAAGFVLYLGSELQLADPTIEAEEGVGNVPGMRGLAYIVYADRLLQPEQANRHPMWRFEVDAGGSVFVTSKPYPVEMDDALAPGGAFVSGRFFSTVDDELDVSAALTGGALTTLVVPYDDGEPEELDVSSALTAGELKTVVIPYDDGDPEELDVSATLTGGELKTVVITYDDAEPEELDVSAALVSGDLS